MADSLTDLEAHAKPAVEKLLLSNSDQLYAQLDLRRKAIAIDPTQAGHFQTTATFDAEFAGPLNVMRDLGMRFFNNVSSDAYKLVCGNDSTNTAARKKIFDAFGGGPTAFAAAIAAGLVSTFSWAPAIAAVVAALIVRLFFKNAYRATCEVWQTHLPKSGSQASAGRKRTKSAKEKRPAHHSRKKKKN